MAKTKRNKSIKNELKRLQEIERHIDKLERERTRIEIALVRDAGGATSAFQKRHARRGLRNYAFNKFRKRRLTYFVITSVGAVMLWAGLWTLVDRHLPNPWIVSALGLTIIWLTRNYR